MLEAFNLFDANVSDIDYFYASRLPGEPADGVEDIHTHPAVLRQNSIGAVCVDTFLPDVALFLPFRSNKERQTAASGDTKRRPKIAGFFK